MFQIGTKRRVLAVEPRCPREVETAHTGVTGRCLFGDMTEKPRTWGAKHSVLGDMRQQRTARQKDEPKVKSQYEVRYGAVRCRSSWGGEPQVSKSEDECDDGHRP